MSLKLDTIKATLREDIGGRDITSELIIPAGKIVTAVIVNRQACVVCGLDIAREVFKDRDKKIEFSPLVRDGKFLKQGSVLARIKGRARPILAAERVALNFLTILSGIATKTCAFVKAVKPYRVKILDTRKTIPGLRKLQKYAVRMGGGYNHRMRLSDMVLIKDNHIQVAKSPGHQVTNLINIINAARQKAGKKVKIEIEVKNLKEFREALKAAPDIIMLDNMKVSQIKKAVQFLHRTPYTVHRTQLEASGGITLKNVKQIAAAGVDMISVGGLTHSISSIDISLDIL